MSTKLFVFSFLIIALGWHSTCVLCGKGAKTPAQPSTSKEPEVNPYEFIPIGPSKNRLLIISLDAFGPRYFKKGKTPKLQKFGENGAAAPYMKNVFPTTTFVNHHSLSTGLFPEHHGIVANQCFDTKLNKGVGYGYELFHYDENVTPLWVANQKNGGRSGVMWPGCYFKYQNMDPTYRFDEYNATRKNQERINEMIKWFKDPQKPANLVMMYYEEPDAEAHAYGADGPLIDKKLVEVDDFIDGVQKALESNGLADTNIIIVSDHGIVTVDQKHIIDLKSFAPQGAFEYYGRSPILQIVPQGNHTEDEIFNILKKKADTLKTFKMIKFKDCPKEWHLNIPQRFGPIIAFAKMYYGFPDLIDLAKKIGVRDEYKFSVNESSVFGCHGYSNDEYEMQAIFLAKGPLFKTKTKLKPVNTIDLFNLFCDILGIPYIQNDGNKDMSIWNQLMIKQVEPMTPPSSSIRLQVKEAVSSLRNSTIFKRHKSK